MSKNLVGVKLFGSSWPPTSFLVNALCFLSWSRLEANHFSPFSSSLATHCLLWLAVGSKSFFCPLLILHISFNSGIQWSISILAWFWATLHWFCLPFTLSSHSTLGGPLILLHSAAIFIEFPVTMFRNLYGHFNKIFSFWLSNFFSSMWGTGYYYYY